MLRRSLSLNPNLVAAGAFASRAVPLIALALLDLRAPILTSLCFFFAAAAQGSYLPQTADTSDDATSPVDSPLIVHSPGQILRRSARTKIRKVGLAGDGGGHRFGPSRRTRTVSGDQSLLDDADTAGDASTDSIESDELRSGDKSSAEALLDDSVASSPSSDAHATDIQYFENVKLPVLDRDTAVSVEDGSWSEHTSSTNDKEVLPAPPPSSLATANLDAPLPPTPVPQRPPLSSPPQLGPSTISPASAEYDWATHQLQQQQPPPSLPPSPAPYPERKDSVHTPPPSLPSLAVQPPALSSSTPSASSSRSSSISEKKKSGWARLGLGVRSSDDDAKKGKKGKGKEGGMSHVVEAAVAKQQAVDREKEREAAQQQAKDKDKESGFFGGLFGKRKSDHEPIPPPERVPSPPEPRIPPPPPTASGQLMPNGTYINFYRLPIHVERAVYRLSHIKLANPRRPLYEQVLISNLM